MKRIVIELAAQAVVLVVLFLVIGVLAGFIGGTVGATANAVAPDFHLKLAARLGLVCGQGETIFIDHSQTRTGVDAYGHPYAGQSNDIYCVSTAEGTRRELTADEYLNAKLAALGAAGTAYTLVVFVPLFLVLEILAAVLIHKLFGALIKSSSSGQPLITS